MSKIDKLIVNLLLVLNWIYEKIWPLDPSENITNLASYNSFNKKVQEIEVSISDQENTEASLQLGVATQEFKSSYNNLHDELKSESSIPKTPFTTSYNTGLAKKVDEHETLLPQKENQHHNLKGKISSETNNNTMSVNSSPSSRSQLMGSASEEEENLIELQETTSAESKSSTSSSISQKSTQNKMNFQIKHVVSWSDPKLSGSYHIVFKIYFFLFTKIQIKNKNFFSSERLCWSFIC